MGLKKILLIDDHEAEHFLLKAMVSDYDDTIEVLSAYDGEEGLEILKQEHETLDCILLDINMPRMDGFEFLEAASEVLGPMFSQTSVAMLTTSLDPDDQRRAMAFPMVKAFLNKPLTHDHVERFAEKLRDV